MPRIVDYATLQAEVALLSGDSSASAFPEVVRSAIESCENELDDGMEWQGQAIGGLRVPEMVIRDVVTFDKPFETLPNEYLELVSAAWVDGDRERPMEQVPADGIGDYAEAYRYTTRPYRYFYSVQGAQIRIAPAPSGPTPVRIVYYGRVPSVSDPNPCYTILLRRPNLYKYGSLRHVAAWQSDDDALAKWTGMFASALRGANKAAVNR